MQPKVLVVSNYRNTYSTRPEAETFIDLARRGFHIDIMTFGDAEYTKRFREEGIKLIDFHPQKRFDKKEISFIREHIQNSRPDIVHLFNGRAILNGIQAARKLPVKVVLYRGYAGNVHWYDPTAYYKFLHPRVDKILCNTEGVAQSITRNLFFDRAKIKVINKGHDTSWYSDIEPIDKTELGIPQDAFMIVNVANNRAMKDIPTLLKASHYLPAELPIHFVLVGRNMDDAANRKVINSSPNRDKIHLPGFRKDRLSIVKSSDIFALTSLYGESITKSVLEAMSLGTTPIITDIIGNKELVEDGKSGLVIPVKSPKILADKILELYHDRKLLARLSKGAKKHIETKLSHERTVNEYEKFYRELAADLKK